MAAYVLQNTFWRESMSTIENVLGVVYPTERGLAITSDGKLMVADRSNKANLQPGDLVIVTKVIRDTRPDDETRGVLFVTTREVTKDDINERDHKWVVTFPLSTRFEFAGKFVRIEGDKVVVQQAPMLVVSQNDRRLPLKHKEFIAIGHWGEEISFPLLRSADKFGTKKGVCLDSNFLKGMRKSDDEFLICSSDWDTGSSFLPYYTGWRASPLRVEKKDIGTVRTYCNS